VWHEAQGLLSRYFRKNAGLLLFVACVYAAGAVAGALAAPALTQEERSGLGSYIEIFVSGFGRNSPSLASSGILRLSLESYLKTAGLIWVLGITVIGLPVVVVVLFIRGFTSGFTACFLAAHMGYKGVLLAATSMLPHSVVSVPALLALATFSLSFGASLFRQTLANRKVAFLEDMTAYTVVFGATAGALALAALIEAYVTPVFIRALAAYLV
jgi:stage II sporulation protein M